MQHRIGVMENILGTEGVGEIARAVVDEGQLEPSAYVLDEGKGKVRVAVFGKELVFVGVDVEGKDRCDIK